MEEHKVVYVLYGGQSVDGMGFGRYKTFTTNRAEAVRFYKKNIMGNPYSTGKVMILHKDKEVNMRDEDMT